MDKRMHSSQILVGILFHLWLITLIYEVRIHGNIFTSFPGIVLNLELLYKITHLVAQKIRRLVLWPISFFTHVSDGRILREGPFNRKLRFMCIIHFTIHCNLFNLFGRKIRGYLCDMFKGTISFILQNVLDPLFMCRRVRVWMKLLFSLGSVIHKKSSTYP